MQLWGYIGAEVVTHASRCGCASHTSQATVAGVLSRVLKTMSCSLEDDLSANNGETVPGVRASPIRHHRSGGWIGIDLRERR